MRQGVVRILAALLLVGAGIGATAVAAGAAGAMADQFASSVGWD